MFFVSARKFLAEKQLEMRFAVAIDFLEAFAIELPIFAAHADAEHRGAPYLALVELLEMRRVKLRQHRVECGAYADEHGGLMEGDISKAFLERIDRPQIAGIALHEQVIERILRVHRELERIVLDRLDDRHR